MMDDLLVEIDTRSFAVSRQLGLAPGAARSAAGPSSAPGPAGHAASHAAPACSPTWAQPSADGAKIYVACNKSNEILEVDAAAWQVARRWPAGDGAYNLAVTRDGRLLLATNKRGQSVSLIALPDGTELARLATTRKIVHGVAVSPDDRYAFVSVEGIGSEPGTVEVIDLAARRRVATADVGQMAGGIAVWRTEGAVP
jgi:DNA-binding beta-propeller fold protein YncE